jgi:uncharacterized protein (DUF924 family)
MALGNVDHDSDDTAPPNDWRAVYDFWFPAGLASADLETHQRMNTWWLRGGATAELPRFAPLVEAASRRELEPWAEHPLGRLSLIIVLDQFPRGLYAGTPGAFATDPQALALTEEGLRNGQYETLTDYWQRVFFTLPLIHAEGSDHVIRADRMIDLVEMQLDDGPEHLRPIREFGLGQARGHRDIAARFGRHPHRNKVLGRSSSPHEALYIETGEFVHHRLPSKGFRGESE